MDILAIVEVWTRCGCDSQSYQPTTLFRSRKGNEMNRKELVIVDSSNTVASLSLSTSPAVHSLHGVRKQRADHRRRAPVPPGDRHQVGHRERLRRAFAQRVRLHDHLAQPSARRGQPASAVVHEQRLDQRDESEPRLRAVVDGASKDAVCDPGGRWRVD